MGLKDIGQHIKATKEIHFLKSGEQNNEFLFLNHYNFEWICSLSFTSMSLVSDFVTLGNVVLTNWVNCSVNFASRAKILRNSSGTTRFSPSRFALLLTRFPSLLFLIFSVEFISKKSVNCSSFDCIFMIFFVFFPLTDTSGK